jgi:hypothetical protein
MLDPGPRPRAASGATKPSPRPERRARRRWPLAALVAVLAMVLVVTVVRDDGSHAPPAAVPASTRVPATITAAPTTVPSTTAAPTTTVPTTTVPSTTVPATTVGGPSTSVPVSLGPGPVLGAARGWALASLDGSRLSLLDLDTGRTARFTFDVALVGDQPTLFFSDRFVYTKRDGAPSVWAQRFVDSTPTIVLDDASVITASANAGRFWVALNQAGLNGEQLVAEVDTGGRRYNVVAVPLGLRVMGASATGLWLQGSGRVYHLASGGELQDLAIGTILDASRRGVLYDDCAIAGPCTLRVANIPGTSPASSNVGPSAEIEIARGWYRSDPAMSPNGRWLLLTGAVLDRRASNQIGRKEFFKSWLWSPDGEWLFAQTENAGTIAWNLADGREIRLGDFDLSGIVAVTK